MNILAPRKKFEFNLEALRGFAAFTVVLTHCFGFSKVLNGFEQQQGIWNYEFPGHLAVLVFFILSGYVIGLTTKQLTWSGVGSYINKRFLRLYPIYLAAICITLLITYNQYSARDILSNLFFFQRVTADPFYEIGVSWSLNYEVLFYLLFIPVSIYQVKSPLVFIASLAFALFFQLVVPNQLLAMYGFGFCFWVVGLWLSKTTLTIPAATSRATLLGLLFLFLAFSSLNVAREIIRHQLHLDQLRGGSLITQPIAILFSDLSSLPLGVVMITYFTSKRIKYNFMLVTYVLLVPLAFILLQIKTSRMHAVDWNKYVLPIVFYTAACACLLLGYIRRTVLTKQLPHFMVEVGAISYSLYLTHFLFIVLIGRISLYYGTPSTFWGRSVLIILLTLVTSYLLEKVWQPRIVRQLKRFAIFN